MNENISVEFKSKSLNKIILFFILFSFSILYSQKDKDSIKSIELIGVNYYSCFRHSMDNIDIYKLKFSKDLKNSKGFFYTELSNNKTKKLKKRLDLILKDTLSGEKELLANIKYLIVLNFTNNTTPVLIGMEDVNHIYINEKKYTLKEPILSLFADFVPYKNYRDFIKKLIKEEFVRNHPSCAKSSN